MAIIKVLNQDTVNQIAAGEVIERPSSIVKELVENAIDAFSTAITVEIKGGGIDLIRVTDNGCGIGKDQIRTAFLPHATSKIEQADDLITVKTLGFRGEALASISAVSKVETVTKTDEGIAGIRYVTEGGQETVFEEVGCPEGTTIIVRSLFYNTPARRKFLKSSVTEAGYAEAFLQRLSMSRPDIAFKFINENRTRISTSGSGKLRDVIYHIYGRDVAANLLPVEREENGIRVSGFIGKPVISRGNRNYENYFVNGRYLKDKIICKGIEDGYKGHAMVRKFPFTVLMITMDPRQADVNVHPAKMEMRFHNGETLYRVVSDAVREAFAHRELIPRISPGKDRKEKPAILHSPEPFEKRRMGEEGPVREHGPTVPSKEEGGGKGLSQAGTEGRGASEQGSGQSRRTLIEERIARLNLRDSADIRKDIDRQMSGAVMPVRENSTYREKTGSKKAEETDINTGQTAKNTERTVKNTEQTVNKAEQTVKNTGQTDDLAVSGKQLSFAEDTLLTKEARPKHRIIGQVFETFWLIEYEDKLFFVDQHAAHEKVMYEKMTDRIRNNEVLVQQLAPPIVLNLTGREQEKLARYADALAEIGFALEEFGEDTVLIRAVPLNLYGMDEKAFFLDLLDGTEDFAGKLNADPVRDRIAAMACKAAVKGNTRMSVREMDALMDQLLALENPYQCPHGRPTIISMSRYELEKKFKRVQG